MNRRQQWKNYLDFDEPSGPVDLVSSAPYPQQSIPRSWMKSILWMFHPQKPSAEVIGQVIEESPVQDSHAAIKADPDAPITKAAAARRPWLSRMSHCGLSTLISGGMGVLVVFTCVWHGLSVLSKALQPSYPLFELGNWDEMQRDMNSLHSKVQFERFSDSEQIQASVKQGQNSMRRCRFLNEDTSTDLGTVIMGLVQEWVFEGRCTSTLPVMVKRSRGKIQKALDCTNDTNATLATAMRQIHEAQARDSEDMRVIRARHASPTSRASSEQITVDDGRYDMARNSISNLTSVHSFLNVIIKSHQLEHERIIRVDEDMGRLSQFLPQPQEGATIHEGLMQQGDHVSTWNCQGYDIPGLRDSFSSMASAVIADEKTIRQFQSRYYPSSFDSMRSL